MIDDKIPALKMDLCGDYMQTPDEIDEILRLSRSGIGFKKIAKELGISRNTVKKYVNQAGWKPYSRPRRQKRLEGLDDWLKNSFLKHKNAEVVCQELKRQHDIHVSLRTVERAIKPYRRLLKAHEKVTVRFETPPGKQMQIDFGSMRVEIGGKIRKVYFFAAILGYSRRQYVQPFLHERQEAWFKGIEGAFHYFGGVPEQILLDNARALVKKHNPTTREVVFNEKLSSFASYWGFTPKACAPFRARTKGKDENTVKYIKKNAIAGRSFASWQAFEQHLSWWMREISDVRVHGTTGEKPIQRFFRDEAEILRSMNGKPPFQQIRELKRVVQNDACVEVDNNFYSVPWHYIKETVTVQVQGNHVQVLLGCDEIASHVLCEGRGKRSMNSGHLSGVVAAEWLCGPQKSQDQKRSEAEFLRPLKEYEDALGGGW